MARASPAMTRVSSLTGRGIGNSFARIWSRDRGPCLRGNKKGRARLSLFALLCRLALLGSRGLGRIRREAGVLGIGRIDHFLAGPTTAARTGGFLVIGRFL